MTSVTRSVGGPRARMGRPDLAGDSSRILVQRSRTRWFPHPDRVIAVGGDGTVRIVADRLAQSGIPMAVVPVGTGNLLARNLEIPLSERDAVEVAFGEHTLDIDLIKLTVDGVPSEHFAVIAGLGVDALIMDETSPELKDTIGAGAYFVAAAKALGVPDRHADHH